MCWYSLQTCWIWALIIGKRSPNLIQQKQGAVVPSFTIKIGLRKNLKKVANIQIKEPLSTINTSCLSSTQVNND